MKRGGLVKLAKKFIAFLFTLLLLTMLPTTAQQPSAWLKVHKTVDLSLIFLKGAGGTPETATVTLSLEAAKGERFPIDLIFVVDRSATADLAKASNIGQQFLHRLEEQDRAALVSFADEGRLDFGLTKDFVQVKEGFKALKNKGKTALGEGLFVATSELINNGREEAVLVEIVLTDGRSNAGRDPLEEAQRAAEEGIAIFTVGVGRNVNKALLSQIAQMTGGLFFESFEAQALDKIFESIIRNTVAKEVRVIETLSAAINYEGAVSNPPAIAGKEADGTTILEWNIEKISLGETWTASFKISAVKEGTVAINQAPSLVTFTDFKGLRVTQDLPLRTIEVRLPNKPPVADFSFSPLQPSIRDTVQFTDKSYDPDGKVVSWSWDFGDGVISTEQNPTHRYSADGTYTVTLKVTDDGGAVSPPLSKTIDVVTEKATATRAITTYLPDDITMPGETFRVEVKIYVNMKLNGLGLDENIPAGWEVKPIDTAGAAFRKSELQWVFVEAIPAGTTKTIIYEVTVPATEKAGAFKIGGAITSASPALEFQVEGDAQVEVKEALPISWVVSRWDTEKDILNLKLGCKITFDQIQQAVTWWLEGTKVPKTGDKTIDFKLIQELIAYWLTDTCVHEPLPK